MSVGESGGNAFARDGAAATADNGECCGCGFNLRTGRLTRLVSGRCLVVETIIKEVRTWRAAEINAGYLHKVRTDGCAEEITVIWEEHHEIG